MGNDQRTKAVLLRAFHYGTEPLLLPNAWDVASARILEEARFAAVATTSAGIAFSCGYPDGEHIPLSLMIETVRRICDAVSVPVTADMEAGYSNAPEDVERMTELVIKAGAVGLNLQDGNGEADSPLMELSLQLEKIKAVRSASTRMGLEIVLNARTDVYLRQVGPAAEQFAETLFRGSEYRKAGADCIFIPGLCDSKIISAVVRQLDCPINILVGRGTPTIAELRDLGVARVTFGSGMMRATCSLLKDIATEILSEENYSLLEGVISHQAMNDLMKEHPRYSQKANGGNACMGA